MTHALAKAIEKELEYCQASELAEELGIASKTLYNFAMG